MDNQTPNMESPTFQMNPPQPQKSSSVGSIIATIVVIAIIILGALYFWGKRIETEKANQALIQNAGTTTDEEMAATAQATQVETVSQDDSINTLQAETQATQTSNLSPELQ